MGVAVSKMVCKHLVNSPIQVLIYRGPLYSLQMESILNASVLQEEEAARASVLSISFTYSKAIIDDYLATDLNQL